MIARHREGLYYYFDQSKSDHKTECMVITDQNKSSDEEQSPAFDVTWSNVGAHRLEGFHGKIRSLSHHVIATDYDFTRPDNPVGGDKKYVPQRGQYASAIDQVVLYGASLQGGTDADRMAQVRADAIGSQRHVLEGSGGIRGFRPGYNFVCDGTTYLTTRIEHSSSAENADRAAFAAFSRSQESSLGRLKNLKSSHATSSGAYRMSFSCVPGDLFKDGKTVGAHYRHPQTTPIPRLDSFVRGTKVKNFGDATPDTKVPLYWVALDFDTNNPKVPVPMRMVQPSGAMQFEVADGSEVLVLFLAGDVDQPVIANIVPNAKRTGPVADPGSNLIQSSTNSRIEMNDNPGNRSIKTSVPVDGTYFRMGEGTSYAAELNTKGSAQFAFGQTWSVNLANAVNSASTYSYTLDDADNGGRVTENVGAIHTLASGAVNHDYGQHALRVAQDQTINVGTSQDTTVGQEHRLSVGSNYLATIGADGSNTIQAASYGLQIPNGPDMTMDAAGTTYQGDHTTTVTQDQIVDVARDQISAVSRDHRLSVTGAQYLDITGAHTSQYASDHTMSIVGNHLLTVAGTHSVVVGSAANPTFDYSLSVGKMGMTVNTTGFFHPDGHSVTVEGYHAMEVKADQLHTVHGNYNINAVLNDGGTGGTVGVTGAGGVIISSPHTIIS